MTEPSRNIRFLNTHADLKQFCKNSTNKIEDPIFTGFTMTIDEKHSPLFFSLISNENKETLRKDGISSGLAEKWEEALKTMNLEHNEMFSDQYELYTLNSKNTIDDRRAGYGLQEKYYIDNVSYGAADYIYMVDKVAIGMYKDVAGGISDIGNGTPSKGQYPQYLNDVNSVNIEGRPDVVSIDGKGQQLNPDDPAIYWGDKNRQVYDKISECKYKMSITKDEHDANQRDLSSKKDQYYNAITDVKVNIDENGKEVIVSGSPYKIAVYQLQKIKDETEKAKKNAEDELHSLQTTAMKMTNVLLDNFNDADAGEKINNIYNTELYDLFKKYSNNSVNFTVFSNKRQENKRPEETNSEVYNNIQVSENVEVNEYIKIYFSIPDYNAVDTLFRKEYNDLTKELDGVNNQNIIDFIKKSLVIQHTRITGQDKPLKQEEIIKLQEDIVQYEKTIYGKDIYGNPGSPGVVNTNGDSGFYGGYYQEYRKALDKYYTDDYSYHKEELDKWEDILDHFDDIERYAGILNEKKEFQTVSNLPTIDNIAKSDGKQLYEVPQTAYDMLGFVDGMKALINEYPYVLQSVTGLDEAYKQYFEVKDPYMGSGEGKITISCLEFLDLRVSSMFNKYFNAVYDRQYRRERVPINLRRFNCSIFVHDIRNFRNALGLKPDKKYDMDIEVEDIVNFAINYVSAIEFKFYDCEVVPEETGNIFDNVSNVDAGEMKKTTFTFTYGNCIINFLPFEDLRRYYMKKDLKDIKLGGSDDMSVKKLGNVETYQDDEAIEEDEDFKRLRVKTLNGFEGGDDMRKLGNVETYQDDEAIEEDEDFKRLRVKTLNGFEGGDDMRKLGKIDTSPSESSSNYVYNIYNPQVTDVLRQVITSIAASTGVPTSEVISYLNVQNLGNIFNESTLSDIISDLGNTNNKKGGK